MSKNPFSIFTVPGNVAPSDQRAAAKSKKKKPAKRSTTKSSGRVKKTTTESARRTQHKGASGETAYGQRMSKDSPINRKKKR